MDYRIEPMPIDRETGSPIDGYAEISAWMSRLGAQGWRLDRIWDGASGLFCREPRAPSSDAALARLIDAVDSVLDEMGASGTSCCLGSKAALRAAFEPYRDPENDTPMPMEAALEVLREAGLLP